MSLEKKNEGGIGSLYLRHRHGSGVDLHPTPRSSRSYLSEPSPYVSLALAFLRKMR